MAGEVKVLADGVQRIVLRAPSDTKTISTKKTILDRLATPKPPQQPILWPSSYLKNSIKEQTLLEYVEDFRRQFVQLFPHRRPLLLCPLNEAKVRKFVSTTIRPSLLPYNDVYDIQPCAEFVADFLTYIPLDEPTKLPDLLPSSSTLLLTPQRTADCLDASIFLVSLLRGAGHAAYVVSGYAPQWITEADQSQVNCPLLDNSAEEARKAREKFEQEQAERRKTARFTIPTRPEHKSKYVAAREAEELAEKERIRKEEEEKNKIVVEKAVDPLHGSRVHVWVLVMRGRRDQPDDVFIEASTGTIYSIQHSPYLGIEAVWNELNYWVNVQKTQVPSQMVYDLSNIINWEYVLIDERRAAAVSKLNNNTSSTTRHSVLTDFETAKDGEEAKEEREVPPEDQPDSRDILDAPLSWASKITIDRVTFQARYPGGSKQVRYKNCLVEKYSDYNEPLRGLIRRITIYEDEECTKVVEIRETFKHRKDYLRERRTYPLLSRTHCMFDPGRPSGLRDFIVTGEKHRAFEFYHGARVDGMIKREERVGEKVIEEYANRDDFLIYRSVAVDTSPAHTLATRRHKVFSISLGKGSAEQPIRKITEKFARNMKLDAEHDVRKRTHLMMQGTIRLDYHYGEKHITHSRHVIDKADKLDQSETEGPSENSLGSMLRVSSTWTPPSRGEEQEMVARLLQIEKDLTTKVRDRETHMMELVQQLELQQHDVQLEKSIYDSAHEQAIQKLADSVGDSEQDASEAANKVDYLSPFLAQYPPGKPLTRRQAQQAKEECLGALKERLLERANIIQEHLDDEQQKLHQRQAMFKRQAGAGAGEEFNKFSEQALFRIDILNARRARHEELALKRYVEMDERLNNDPRLAILQQPDGM